MGPAATFLECGDFLTLLQRRDDLRCRRRPSANIPAVIDNDREFLGRARRLWRRHTGGWRRSTAEDRSDVRQITGIGGLETGIERDHRRGQRPDQDQIAEEVTLRPFIILVLPFAPLAYAPLYEVPHSIRPQDNLGFRRWRFERLLARQARLGQLGFTV